MGEITKELCERIIRNQTAYSLRHFVIVPLAQAWLAHEAQVEELRVQVNNGRDALYALSKEIGDTRAQKAELATLRRQVGEAQAHMDSHNGDYR